MKHIWLFFFFVLFVVGSGYSCFLFFVFFPTLVTHTTLKMWYQVYKSLVRPFHRGKTKETKHKTLTRIKKDISHLLQPIAPIFILVVDPPWPNGGDDAGLMRCGSTGLSYYSLRASAFNKCHLRSYVTSWLPTLKSTCPDGILPAHEFGPATRAWKKTVSVAQ